jgi:hypothetical protein
MDYDPQQIVDKIMLRCTRLIGYRTDCKRNGLAYNPLALFYSSVGKSKSCLNGWTKYKNNCYKMFDTKTKFADAEKACAKLAGASLAEINNGGEMYFLMYKYG